MKKISPKDQKSFSVTVSSFFAQYNLILYFILVSIALGVCMLTIINLVNLSSQTDDSSVTPISQNFDKTTIQRLDELDASAQHATFQLPSGRTNPFAE